MKTPCEKWLDEVEQLLGHSLDADQDEVGYSIDYAVENFRHGESAKGFARFIKSGKCDCEAVRNIYKKP